MASVERICRNCEHFDAGGLGKDGAPLRQHGDCHNGISGRFTTNAGETCAKGFYLCTTRWPLERRYHQQLNPEAKS